MKIELAPLPFDTKSLEPYISAQTIDFHYNKHHRTYIDNLNNLLSGSTLEGTKTLEDLIQTASGAIFNNAAQIWNHSFYWNCLTSEQTKPSIQLLEAINSSFESFDDFEGQFKKAAISIFGSGWAWLSKTKSGKLEITQESNAGNPIKTGLKPILVCDVWEHAYYLDKQNKRAEYISNFWKIINWNFVSEQFAK